MACPPMGLWLRASLAFARYVFFYSAAASGVHRKGGGGRSLQQGRGSRMEVEDGAEERQHRGGGRVPKRVQGIKKREERKEKKKEKKVKIEQARRTRIGFAQGACRCSN